MLIMKVKGRLGPGNDDMKTMRVLNRVVEWTDEEIICEADQRHADLLVKGLVYEVNTQGVVTPGVKTKLDESYDRELNEQEASSFISLASRSYYLAQDRPDIQYVTQELCRDMSSPKERSWLALTRLGGYLQDKPRMVHTFPRQ